MLLGGKNGGLPRAWRPGGEPTRVLPLKPVYIVKRLSRRHRLTIPPLGDMLSDPKGQGFSGYARPNGPRWRLNGLPDRTCLFLASSEDIQGSILVPMKARSTFWAEVPADG